MSVNVRFKIGQKKGITANYNVSNEEPIKTIFRINAPSAAFASITGSPYDNANLKNALDAKADKSELDADIAAVDETINDLETTVTNNYTTLDNKIDIVQSDLSGNISTIENTINNYGDIVTYNASDFATYAQGQKADTALQPNDNISELNNDVGYITSASLPTVNDATIIIQKNGSIVDSFSLNQANNDTINITVPTKTSDLTNDAGYVTENYIEQNYQSINNPDWDEATYNSNVGSNSWTTLIYGANTFVAVGRRGYVSTSSDFTTWTNATQISSLGDNYWMDGIYDGSKFIIISRYGHISTSINGTTWTSATQISNLGELGWCGLNYNGSQYLALSYDGYISTSTDGSDWDDATQVSNLGDNNWTSLCYGNKYVAISYDGHISTSTDGTNWTQATLNSNLGDNSWTCLCYTGNQYIALGRYGHISTSTDGINWTQAVYNSNLGENSWYSIIYKNTTLYASSTTGYFSSKINGTIQNNIQGNNLLYGFDNGNNFEIINGTTGLIPDERLSNNVAKVSNIPTKTSQLINDSGFITNAVNNLINYYLKSETYTKLEVQQLIASIPQFRVKVVQTLPVTGERMVLYLVPKQGEAPDVYNEYIWVADEEEFELLGSTAVDLTGYVTNSDLTTALADYALTSDIPTDNSELTNGAGYITGINQADVIDALGYTPYNATNPNGYITNSALAGYAQTSDLATVATSGSYNDLSNKPTIPTVNDGTLTIQANGTTVGTFTANQSGNTTANIVVPDSATWGNITGDLSDQTDLASALSVKQDLLTADNGGTDIAISTGGAGDDVTVSGTGSVLLENAEADSLNSVTLTGGTTINIDIPSDYTRIEFLEATGTQYIDSGVVANFANNKIEQTATVQYTTSNTSRELMGTNGYGFWGKNASNKIEAALGQTTVTDNALVKNVISWTTDPDGNKLILNVNSNQYTSTASILVDANYAYYVFALGIRVGSGASASFLCHAKVWDYTIAVDDEVVCHLIPVRRNSDNVLGMYDIVTGTFKTNAGTGTFTAGSNVALPSPTNPLPIVSNNGQLKASANLFDQSLFNTDAGITVTYYTFTIENGTYTMSTNIPYASGSLANVFLFAGQVTSGASSGTNGVTINTPRTITVTNGKYTVAYRSRVSAGDTAYNPKNYNWMLARSSSAQSYQPYVEGGLYVDGITETITDSANNSATAEMLLSIGDYTDTQEILTGAVTRKVGIIVLNGTEEWGYNTSGAFYCDDFTDILLPNECICTHFVGVSSTFNIASMPNNSIKTGSITITRLYVKTSDYADVQAFKTWLAQQSVNGTPVIIVYPLATETTETVIGQTLTTIQGDSTLTISQASINNLPISANYTQKAGMTINFTNDTGYITSSALSGYVQSSDLATVATSGDYDDLTNKPTIPTVGNGTITITQGGTTKGTFTVNQSGDTTIALDAGGGGGTVDQTFDGTSANAQSGIAIAGELTNYATVNDISDFITSSDLSTTLSEYVLSSDLATEYYTVSDINMLLADYSQTSYYATVAFTGDYDDLINKPTIPSGVIVDQTYDGTSTNAQSGVAIAGAGFLTSHQSLANYVDLSSAQTITGTKTFNAIITNSIRSTSSDVYNSLINYYNHTVSVGNALSYVQLQGIQSRPQYRLATNSPVDIALFSDIPTATSDLTNDSGYITANDIPSELFIAEYGTTTYAEIGAALTAGKSVILHYTETWGDTYARLDYYQESYNYYSFSDFTGNAFNQFNVDNSNTWSVAVRAYSDTDLSNLSATGKTVIDGQWVTVSRQIASDVSVNGSTDLTYTLSDVPNDGNKYEVLLTGQVYTSSSSGNQARINVSSDIVSSVYICAAITRTSQSAIAFGSAIIPVGNRQITVARDTGWNGTFNLWIRGYRRIGSNS